MMRGRLAFGLVAMLSYTPSVSFGAEVSDEVYAARPDDVETIEACIKHETARAEVCIERVAQSCIEAAEKAGSGDLPGLMWMHCWGREGEAWDVLLNRAYAEQLEVAQEVDKQSSSTDAPREAVATLRAAQRAWLAFRDAEQGRLWAVGVDALSHWRAADMEGAAVRLTAMRTLDLLRD